LCHLLTSPAPSSAGSEGCQEGLGGDHPATRTSACPGRGRWLAEWWDGAGGVWKEEGVVWKAEGFDS